MVVAVPAGALTDSACDTGTATFSNQLPRKEIHRQSRQ